MVAEIVERCVGGVFNMREVVLDSIGFDVAASEREQGTYDVALDW